MGEHIDRDYCRWREADWLADAACGGLRAQYPATAVPPGAQNSMDTVCATAMCHDDGAAA